MRGLLINYGDQNIVIGGDFNTCLNTNLDKMGGLTDNESQCAKGIKSLLTEIDLIDIWRIRNPNKLYYTRREMSRSGLVQSRLDFWLVSISLEFQITKCSIEPGNSSDHSLVKLTLDLIETQKRGKGFWKFNNSLLTDSKYINIIKEVISDIKHSVVMENKAQLWDFIKCRIRSETISYSIFKAKESQRKENELATLLKSLENTLVEDNSKHNEYVAVKQEWEGYQKEKFRGAAVRSKSKWVEEGEKNSKYFLNLEKRNYNIKHIKKLICNTGVVLTNPKAIIEEEKNYYKKLYSSNIENNLNLSSTELRFLDNPKIPKLSVIDKNFCEMTLQKKDYALALTNSNSNWTFIALNLPKQEDSKAQQNKKQSTKFCVQGHNRGRTPRRTPGG